MKSFLVLVAVTILNIGITVYQVLSNEISLAAINGFCAGLTSGLAFAAFLKYRWEKEEKE